MIEIVMKYVSKEQVEQLPRSVACHRRSCCSTKAIEPWMMDDVPPFS